VTFIPEPGKPSYTKTKAYRPICLSSFLLQTLERLVNRHTRNDVLGRNPLHNNQHAYQLGISTDTELNSVVSTTEKALQTQEIALGAFLDIKGAFDRTSNETISSAQLKHVVLPLFERWITSMQVASVLGAVCKVVFYLPCCETCPWTNCYGI
jgi:Reverse transcriptase (RNA-dependent DNA polymerase).